MELIGEITDETDKAIRVKVMMEEGETAEEWVPKSLIENETIPGWKAKEKFGVDAVVKLIRAAGEAKGEAKKKEEGEGISENIMEKINTLAGVLAECNKRAVELVLEMVSSQGLHLSDRERAELTEQYAVTLFIGVRQSL